MSTDPRKTIQSYQNRQKRTPIILGSFAVFLVIAGLLVLALWLTNPENADKNPFFQVTDTETPTLTATSTLTPTPTFTSTSTPTLTPTVTETPTITPSPTIDGPFYYTVQEGDNLTSIAAKFGVDVLRIMEVNEMEDDTVFVGVPLLIPDPNEEAPTRTPIPSNLPKGTLIDYRVQPGDNLTLIANAFNSTEEAILEANEDLDDPNAIFAGQILKVPVNLVTPVPTATDQPGASTPGSIVTLTPTPAP